MQMLSLALFATLLFVLISLPWTYELTDKIFGKWRHTIDAHGCPTTFGFAIHALAFFVLFLISLYIPWGKIY